MSSAGILRRPGFLTLAIASCFAGNFASANPLGPLVVNGQVTFAGKGGQLTVTNTPGAIINWQSFSIGAGEATRFIQQSASSAVLNRVTGGNPSAILGTLQSNGRVFLVNPAGIAFGAGSRIDTAGLVASTLALSDADFLGGRYRFTESPGNAAIVNQGSITANGGGKIYLVASSITNSGVIRSDAGDVLLAAGRSVELADANSPDVRVQITAPDNEALNVGRLIAQSGRIGIYGGLVRQAGTVSADSAVLGENGKIVFRANGDVILEGGSRTTANGPRGGSITVHAAEGAALVAGTIEAKGEQAAGGQVQVLGNRVGLTGQATIDASGASGGGAVLIGGDRHGDNPEVQNAFRTFFGAEASVRADAIQHGNGGKVIVWSDDTTRFYGNISARGGAQGGDGGFAEVSGKNSLVYRGASDLGSARGNVGTLLLDPRDITIQAAGADDAELNAGAGIRQSDGSPQVSGQILSFDSGLNDFTLSAAALSGANANVVLQAQRDINVNSPVALAADRDFTAQAGRDININAALTTRGVSAGRGNIHLESDSPYAGSFFFSGDGRINVNAPVNACGGAAGGCAGGNVTLIGGGSSVLVGGFALSANVQAGDGGINVALSDTVAGRLNFLVGAAGTTQLNSGDAGSLLTSGPLVLGSAVMQGPDGSQAASTALVVNSLNQLNGSSVSLSPSSGSSFTLVAGNGGIRLDRNLTTFQPTVINTTGPFTLNAVLDTSDNDLSVIAAAFTSSSGSIATGSAAFTCAGTGCPPDRLRAIAEIVTALPAVDANANYIIYATTVAVNDVSRQSASPAAEDERGKTGTAAKPARKVEARRIPNCR